jgi:hypothetical protein
MAVPRTYNMFRRSDAPEIFCAVCQDAPVPRFIDGESWLYHGTVRDDRNVPAGFLPHVARKASDMNGFYLFYVCGRRASSSNRASQAGCGKASLETIAA